MHTTSLLLSVALFAAEPQGHLEIRVSETRPDGREALVPCRIHLLAPDGSPVTRTSALSLEGSESCPAPFFRDHYDCAGTLAIDLPEGRYRFAVERGPEYRRATGETSVRGGETIEKSVTLRRWIDMARRGWWSGDLHVHRPPEDMALLLRAEDLHVAPVLTVWNRSNLWTQQPLPDDLVVEAEPTRFYHWLGCEDERRGGALLYFNRTSPLDFSRDTPESPPSVAHLREARRSPGGWVDIEKPFWWDVPVWVAEGGIDSIGLANNHMYRVGMLDGEAWGRPRDLERFPSPRGNGLYTQDLYYRLLNCGFRIPPSAGSASGVLPNPLGYNRVYVRVDEPLRYDAWWEALSEGRSFVTNGPVLLVEANGRPPGEVFRSSEGEPVIVELDARVGANDPLESLEVVRDGTIVERIVPGRSSEDGSLQWLRPRPLAFRQSGWFLVRTIAAVPDTFRFASTAPFYVEVGESPRTIHTEDVDFFLEWIDQRARQIRAYPDFASEDEREATLRAQQGARAHFETLREKG